MSLGTVIVTGGTSGIGLGVATEVIKLGSRVVVASSTQAKIDEAVAQLNKLAGETRAFGFKVDLSDENTLEENVVNLFKYASSAEVTGNNSGKINHVAHTAGDSPSPPKLEDWKPAGSFKSWTVRYLAAVTLAKHAPNYLAQGNKSSITFTTGTLISKPLPGLFSMLGSGGATEAVARALAVDLAPIRVNTVAPGAIDTPMMRGFADESQLEFWKKDNLLGKLGSPEEAAQPYIYFMKDSFATGLTLRSDGGRLLKTTFGN